MYLSNGQVLARDPTTAQDNGLSFPCFFVIGSIVLAHSRQWAELESCQFDFALAGNPTVSYLVNEISGPFSQFDWTQPLYDPALVYGTTTSPTSYSPRLYEFKQSVNSGQLPKPLMARHMQIRVDYPQENAFHELFGFCINGSLCVEA